MTDLWCFPVIGIDANRAIATRVLSLAFVPGPKQTYNLMNDVPNKHTNPCHTNPFLDPHLASR